MLAGKHLVSQTKTLDKITFYLAMEEAMKITHAIQSALKTALPAIALLAAGSMLTLEARADFKPTKDLLLVTHSSPGTGNDLLLRAYVQIWKKNKLLPAGIKAKVRNVRGGGGKKARKFVAVKHKGNEHLLWSYTPTQLMRPLIRKSKIDHKSFTTIALTAIDPLIIVVNASSPYKSMKDLVTAIKKNPNKIKQGGGPFGNSSSVVGVQLKKSHGLKFTYTPYKGGGDAVIQLLGGHIDFIVENPAEVREHVKAGKLRILAAMEKLPLFPKVPTFEAAGYPIRVMSPFRGVMMPPGVSKAAVAYYIDLFKRTQKTKDWKDYLTKNALNETFIAGADMQKWVNKEAEDRTAVLKSIGMFKRFKKKKKKK